MLNLSPANKAAYSFLKKAFRLISLYNLTIALMSYKYKEVLYVRKVFTDIPISQIAPFEIILSFLFMITSIIILTHISKHLTLLYLILNIGEINTFLSFLFLYTIYYPPLYTYFTARYTPSLDLHIYYQSYALLNRQLSFTGYNLSLDEKPYYCFH